MSERRNLFAFTEVDYRPADYPAFISINEEEDGQVTVTVRSRNALTAITITLPKAVAKTIAHEVLSKLS